jgi:hypothetical protein
MTTSKAQSPIEFSRPASGERRLTELGITLSAPPEPFGMYVEAVKEGSLLFLNGMFRTQGREAKFIGRVGSELLRKVFGKDRNLAVFVYAVASLPIGAPIELEVIFEVGG